MKLNADAKATLRDASVTQAAWARAHGFSDGRWDGDACGCPDDRCIGFHDFENEECGCLAVLLDELIKKRQMAAANAVKVRVSGDTPGIATVLQVLHDAAETGGFEIAGQTRPRPNRYEPGCRVYLTLRFADASRPAEADTSPAGDITDSCGAAHSRQAIRRPAAPTQSRSFQERGTTHDAR